jgi:predicted ATPase
MTESLSRVEVQGFCSLADVCLEPGRLTVLIGANGSGKSNLLRALKLAPLLRTKSLRTFIGEAGGASALLHYGPKRTQAITLSLDFVRGEGANRYSARLGYAAGDSLIFLDEVVGYRPDGGTGVQEHSLGAGHKESRLEEAKADDRTAKNVRWCLGRMNFFHFHDTSVASPLRTNARPEDHHYLRSDGSNLAAYLRYLLQSPEEDDQAAWRRIKGLVQRIAPMVKDLQPTPVASNGNAVRLDWIDDQDQVFGAHQLSDGTLRAIALITALAQPTERLPRFISIDEPELGLHPAAITLLADLARSVSPHCQVLFATQSAAFLDHFEPEEVVVAGRNQGATTLRRLDRAELESWLEEYTLSEVYEKGVIGGRP